MLTVKLTGIRSGLISLFLAGSVSTGQAQERYILERIRGPVTLDGMSDEPAWQGIEPLPVVMHQPNFGQEPSERTEILIGYDDDNLYVAGRFYDREPSKIQSTTKKRDNSDLSSDGFGILIDSFNDKENAVAFFTTPSGQRSDVTVFNDAQGDFPVNSSWNTFWDVVSVRTEKGWFAELRIPFSSLRFQDRDGRVVMGLIAWRWIARKYESVIFPAIPPDWGWWSQFKPSQMQEAVFEGVFSQKPLYIAPYLLGGGGQSFELNDIETAYHRIDNPAYELGIDVKYGLTSNLTLDVTANTDFAQVEADDQQINLTRFDLFFPEKRLFFQERSSNFEFDLGGPNRLFYSRRIGIHDGNPVPIYGGLRLVGRVGPWDLGILNMQTAAVADLFSENFGVVRLRRQVINPYTYVGGIVTSRTGTDGSYNRAYGLDGIFRLFGDDYLKLNWAQTFDDSLENKPASLEPARIRVNWQRRIQKGLGYNLGYSRSGATFNPAIGFQVRDNYTRYGGRLWYGWIPGEKSTLFSHQIFLNGSLVVNNTSKLAESAELGSGWEFTTKSGYSGEIQLKHNFEDVPDTFSLSDDVDVPVGQYNFFSLESRLATPMSSLFFIETSLETGFFYGGQRVSFRTSPRWSISSDLELSGTYELNRVTFPDRQQKLVAHIGRVRTLFMLNIKFSVSAFIQYNSATDAVTTNLRLRYNPQEGNDLYLVYDEGLNTNRSRGDPVLPLTSNRTVLLKYTYTFNL